MFALDWQSIIVALMVFLAAAYVWKNFVANKMGDKTTGATSGCGSGGCARCGGCGVVSSPTVATQPVIWRDS